LLLPNEGSGCYFPTKAQIWRFIRERSSGVEIEGDVRETRRE